MIFNETLDEKYQIIKNSSSEGTQSKWYKNGFWYKTDSLCEEGKCEFISSVLLQHSTLDSSKYVVYEQGIINERKGCRSRSFLNNSEEFLTLHRIYELTTGRKIANELQKMDTVKDRIEYTITSFKEMCDLDLTNYLRNVCTLDYIILNEDRHFNNLGIIFDGSVYREAPIFDNGISLLSGNYSYRKQFSVANNIQCANPKGFGVYKKSLDYLGKGFSINSKEVMKELEKNQITGLEVDVLKYQMEQFNKLSLPEPVLVNGEYVAYQEFQKKLLEGSLEQKLPDGIEEIER